VNAVASEKLVEKALEQNEDRLSRLPNVVGLGIVARHEDEPGAKQLAVGVYVAKKMPAKELRRADRIPKRLRVNTRGSYRLVPVRVIEQGEVALEPEGGLAEPVLGKEPL
jgi:hypothetical protein